MTVNHEKVEGTSCFWLKGKETVAVGAPSRIDQGGS